MRDFLMAWRIYAATVLLVVGVALAVRAEPSTTPRCTVETALPTCIRLGIVETLEDGTTIMAYGCGKDYIVFRAIQGRSATAATSFTPHAPKRYPLAY
jgi:hypothetical protein